MYNFYVRYELNKIITEMPDFRYNSKVYYNPVEFAMDRIGGTWKMPILWRLQDKIMRYSELQKDIPHISQKPTVAVVEYAGRASSKSVPITMKKPIAGFYWLPKKSLHRIFE